jgi:hypothetical protein
MLGKIAAERLIEQEKVNKQLSQESKELNATSILLKLRIWTWRKPLGNAKMVRRSPKRLLNGLRRILRNCKKLMTMI